MGAIVSDRTQRVKALDVAKKISGYKEPIKSVSPIASGTTPLSDEEYRKTTGRQRNSSTLLGG